MKKAYFILPALFFSLSASADLSIKGDGFELSEKCLKLEGEHFQIQTKECEEWREKHGKENRGMQSGNNPGKGHDKDKDKGKKKDKS